MGGREHREFVISGRLWSGCLQLRACLREMGCGMWLVKMMSGYPSRGAAIPPRRYRSFLVDYLDSEAFSSS